MDGVGSGFEACVANLGWKGVGVTVTWGELADTGCSVSRKGWEVLHALRSAPSRIAITAYMPELELFPSEKLIFRIGFPSLEFGSESHYAGLLRASLAQRSGQLIRLQFPCLSILGHLCAH